MADQQGDMTAVVQFVHEQVRAQLKPEYACLFILVHRGGDVAAAGDVPSVMLPSTLERVRKLHGQGDSTRLILLPPGVARA